MSVIYILAHPRNPGVCKIGQSGTDPKTRRDYQGIAWSDYAKFPVAEERRLGAEKYIHKMLLTDNVNIGGGAREIFSISPSEAKSRVEILLKDFVEKISNDVNDPDYWKYVATEEERLKHVFSQARPLTNPKLAELKHQMQNLREPSFTASHNLSFGHARSIAAEYGVRIEKDRYSMQYKVRYGDCCEYIGRSHVADMDEYTLRQFCRLITRGGWVTKESWPKDDAKPEWKCNDLRRSAKEDRYARYSWEALSSREIAKIVRPYAINMKDLGEMYEISYDEFTVYIAASYFTYMEDYSLERLCRLIVSAGPRCPFEKGENQTDRKRAGIYTCINCGNEEPRKREICPVCKGNFTLR